MDRIEMINDRGTLANVIAKDVKIWEKAGWKRTAKPETTKPKKGGDE